jgi:hypothetical protein
MAEANEKRRVVEVAVVRGTRVNSLRYNTACGYIFYKKEQRLVLNKTVTHTRYVNQLFTYMFQRECPQIRVL